MATTAAGTPVFLEVRTQLRSALLILGEPKEGGTPMDISITPSSLQVKTPADCTELRLPAEVRLVPSSCRGLQYVAGDGLHLRLQVWAESNAKLISMFNQNSQARECCTFYCQSCGEVIIRDRKLLRLLPLPSENWGALVGEWCCHPDPFANKPLHPQENDCFIGDSFFLVNLRSDLWQPRPELAPVETHCLSSENHFKLKPKANTKVICKRCKVMLGETMSSETTKFYKTEIIIQPSERNFPIIPRSQFVQSVIAQCLVELSTARSTFRFTIQGHDGKVYILLWLLNSDSLVIESLGSSRGITKFPLLEDILKADSSSAWNAVKVLYQPCVKSRNEKLSSAWESDISIHTLTLPSATCLELLLILSRNNATLPPSLRYMNSFQMVKVLRIQDNSTTQPNPDRRGFQFPNLVCFKLLVNEPELIIIPQSGGKSGQELHGNKFF
ncbi:E3 ubiquitin-protein ligase E3D isoform X2 [Panthera leo]|uniref:E3 ubiquitin-protein ligase E3D isoform X2 n=1 Tax=Panthera leo TaxID=9689 RepID=UPI001C695E0F|nr:E3 ubiquitin-protein ligase E3D isoform X2 [Panthera leo]